MNNHFAAVHQDQNGEILLRKFRETEYGPEYDVPHFMTQRRMPGYPALEDWQRFGTVDGVGFVPLDRQKPLTELAVTGAGRVPFFTVLLRSSATIAYAPAEHWRTADLRYGNAPHIGAAVLGPYAQRLRWALQNDELVLRRPPRV